MKPHSRHLVISVARFFARWAVLCAALALIACSNSSSSSQPSPPSPPSGQNAATPQPGDTTETAEDVREKRLARLMERVLETEHLRRHRVDDAISEQAFSRYLEDLDPGKLFLLASHVSRLDRYVRDIDDEMERGRFDLAHEAGTIYAERLAVVRGMVESILAQPIDLQRPDTIETDAKKLAYCKTDAELEQRWRDTLTREIVARVARMEELAKLRAEREAAASKDKDKSTKDKSTKDKSTKDRSTKDKDKGNGNAAADTSDGSGPADGALASADGVGDDDDLGADGKPEDIPATLAEREAKARKDAAKNYATRFTRLAQTEPIDRTEVLLDAVAGVYDPHTTYLPPERKENFDIEISGSLEGIGALLGEDEHYIRVVQIVPGSASWRQGELEAGDVILSVTQEGADPVDIGDMRLRDVVRMIRGKKGTVVTLSVQKPDNAVRSISITRDVVEIEATYAKGAILEQRGVRQKVGYIYLPGFYGNTRASRTGTPERSCTDDVRKLLDIFSDRKVDAAILDLRGNGGGLLNDAQDMSGLFIETGPIVQTRAADGSREILADRDPSVAFHGNVVILVDRFSASAAEILAAALQDYNRAVIVGTGATHGKGTVQVLASLDELAGQMGPDDLPLGVVKLTRMQFFRINGASTQLRGVTPDVLLPDPDAYIEAGERSLDHAIPWSEVEALQFTPWPGATWNTRVLVEHSQARQAKNPVFAVISKRSDLLARRREQTRQPLGLDAFRAERDRQRKELEALGDAAGKDWPARLVVTPIDYDGALAAHAAPRPSGRDRDKASPGGKARSQVDQWKDSLSRDPWVDEATQVLREMDTSGKNLAGKPGK